MKAMLRPRPSSSARRAGLRALAFASVVSLTGVVGAQPAAAPASDAAPPAPAATDADSLYKEGINAFKEGRLEDAYKLLGRAWEKKQSVDIAANLGVVEMKLNKPRDAAEHLSYALELYPVGGDPEARSILEQRYQDARKQIGAVRVACNVPGAAIQVDGEALGKAPLTEEKFIDPGQRKFTAVLKGYENGEVLVKIEPGSDITVEIKLSPKPPGEGDKPPVVTPEERPLWPVLALGGVGVVGLGLGIGFVVSAQGAKSDLEASGCRSASCAAGQQDGVDQYNLGMSVGVPSLVVGAVSLASMGVYLGWMLAGDSGEPEKQSATWVLPIVGPENAGLAIGGKF